MTLSARGPKEYPLNDLDPDRFEMLTFLLARAEDQRVVHIRSKWDHGLDARLPTVSGQTLRGWQAKRCSSGVKWTECQESVRRALAFWRPLRITFAFSIVLSAKDQVDFRERLIDEFPLLHLDWWDASEINARLHDGPAGQRAAKWAFEDHDNAEEALRRALAVGGELTDAGQAAARVAEVQQFVRERDPHLHYTVVSRDEEGPVTPPAIETVLSVDVDIEGSSVRFDAAERYPGAAADLGLGGRLLFSEDDAGRSARAAVEKAMAEGEQLRVTSGVQADFNVPPGLRGLMPEGPIDAEIELGPSATPQIEGPSAPGYPTLLRCGEAELGLILTNSELEGWDVAGVGSAGGFEMWIAWRGPEGERESGMGWRWKLGQGTAREQLLAAQIMLCAHRGKAVELVDPVSGEAVAGGTFDPPEDLEDAIADLEAIVEFLSMAAEAEAWLGVPISPPARPSEEDLKALGFLLSRAREPDYTGTWTEIEVVLSKSLPRGGQGEWAFAFFQPLRAELFGEEHYLGTERGHIAKGEISAASGEEGPGDTVKIVPTDAPGEVAIHFFSPGEMSEDEARGPVDK